MNKMWLVLELNGISQQG